MKQLLFAILLLSPVLASSQDIDIPDPDFLFDLINNGVDTNGDGIIQVAEAEATESLNIFSAQSIEGIQHFINLIDLDLEAALIMEFDITNLGRLERLTMPHFFGDVDLSGNPLLRVLNSAYGDLSSLDLSNNLLLDTLDISHNGSLDSLDLTNNASLSFINAEHSFLSFLNIPNCPELKFLNLNFSQLEELNVTGCPKLEFLNLEFNSLLESVDLSANPELKELNINGVHELRFLNLSNGTVLDNFVYDFFASKEELFICVDIQEFDWMQNLVNNNSNEPENVSVSTVCNHSQGGNFTKVSGNFGFGMDGVCDFQETIFPNVQFLVESNQGFSFSSSSAEAGEYEIYLPATTGIEYTITPQLFNAPIFGINPPQIQVIGDSSNPEITQDFCISPRNVMVPDVKMSIIPIDIARPGFEVAYKVIIENQGNTSSDGTMVVDYPEDFVSFISSTGTWTDNNTHLEGMYSDLLPFQRQEFELVFRLNSPMDDPALNDGDVLKYEVVVFPDQVDGHSPSLTFELCQDVVNSFDPNDKTCLNGAFINIDSLENNPLVYQIRFENTGTADAVNITIQDEIDILKYDLSTIRLIDASHPVQMQSRSNTVDFVFADINLPWQDELNDGYVVFEIETLDNIAINDSIINAADIFFDFNFPIVTEDAISIVVEDLDSDGYHHLEDCDDKNPDINPGMMEIENNGQDDNCDGVTSLQDLAQHQIEIYPNPTEDILRIKAEENIEKVIMTDINGKRILKSKLRNRSTLELDISYLERGIYIVEIQLATSQEKITRKLTKL
jgi:hypothetical protein